MLTDKDKKQLIIVGVLVFVLFIVVVFQIKSCNAKRAKYLPKAAISKKPKNGFVRGLSTPSPTTTKTRKEVTSDDYQEWQGSPFSIQRRSPKGSGDTSSFQLSGVVLDKDNPKESYAILNDYILKEGDQFEGVTLLEIKEDSVIIERKDKKYELTMW